MKFAVVVSALVGLAAGQGGGEPPRRECSSNVADYATPAATSNCLRFSRGNTYSYPRDFAVLNDYVMYECPSSDLRIMRGNGIPPHDVTQGNPNNGCEIPWHMEMPLSPNLAGRNTH